ncbi:MAG: hypothetical protein ACTS5F_00225 [Candidatus Hodgkinia cicadicola]
MLTKGIKVSDGCESRRNERSERYNNRWIERWNNNTGAHELSN